MTIAKELCIPCGFRRPPSRGGLRGGLRGLRNDIRVALPTLCRLRTAVALVRGGPGGAAQARRAETAPSLAMPRPTSSIGTRDGCLREGGNWAVHERSEPGLHSRWRGRVLFPLLLREKGACLLPQRQEAARGCRLRRQPERVTPAERRQAAKTACSLPTHRPGVGAIFLCSWAARWCPSTYFLLYSAQIRY